MKQSRRSSVRTRLILIYFMLVFIAMAIVSVYLLDRMENYQLSSLKENITNTVSESNLLSFLGRFDALGENSTEIQENLDLSWTSGFTQELSVVDDKLLVVASTNTSLIGFNASDVFDADIIIRSLLENVQGESDTVSSDIPVKNLSYPVKGSNDKITGVVYVRADLSSINSFMRQSRTIFIQSTLLALAVTVILGVLLARSITVPITSVTESVEKMSQGDFQVEVPVKSDDEIGQLAEMFNLLREKLDNTITEINNEKSKLGTILEYMADGLIAMDLNGKIIHVNPTARAILGVNQTLSLDGTEYDDLLGNRNEKLAFTKIKTGSMRKGGQTVYRQEDDTYAIRYDRFKDEDGSDAGIILIMQDMTERQKVLDMQTDFVANVSHELKTPLTNIKSYTETLLDGAIDDKDTAIRFLQIVDKEADRMNRLVKDLLQLSRLDHSQEPMNMKESNIVVVVNMAIMKVEMTAKQKNLFLESLYDVESEIRVMLDRDRMEQVVMNVLSNAIKYTVEGGVYVDIKEYQGGVDIIVRDTGIGIPEASINRIFERFYRVDKARSRAMGGTGLGLAITKQIIDEHKGTIKAESVEGEGTTITITLPTANRRGVRNIE